MWTVDIKLTWLTGPFGVDIETRNVEEKFACLTNECARSLAESTICASLMPYLYSKEEKEKEDIGGAGFEEMFKDSIPTSRKFREKFPDYDCGLEVGRFGVDYYADFDGWVWIFCEIKEYGVREEEGEVEEEAEGDKYGAVQENESSNMAVSGEEVVALVTKRMEEAREG
ncbi:hypothetical protein EAE96_008773 [Botrytis aclada]|nr:hypothetical protein EAE96_008773 [Botrytis aclada]